MNKNIVEQIKDKLRNCDHKVGFLTVSVKHSYQYGSRLNSLGVEVVFDHLIDTNKFYIT